MTHKRGRAGESSGTLTQGSLIIAHTYLTAAGLKLVRRRPWRVLTLDSATYAWPSSNAPSRQISAASSVIP